MSEKLKKIISIAEQANHSDLMEIWTNTYIARGHLIKSDNQIVEGLVSLKNVKIFPIFSECEATNGAIERQWLNIFEDQVISFTVIRG